MGSFPNTTGETVVHPDRMRRIHVAASLESVAARIDEHGRRSRPGVPVELGLARTGGWTTVVLPGRIHPWAFHDLTRWLVDIADADVVAVAEVGEGQIGYWLVADEHDAWLCGYDDRSESLSVNVPDNALVVGDDLPHPPATATQTLVDHGVPTDLHYTHGDQTRTVTLEDPGPARNPGFVATHDSRDRMTETG